MIYRCSSSLHVALRGVPLRPRLAALLLLAVVGGCDCDVEPLASVPGRVLGVVCDPQTGEPAAAQALTLTPKEGVPQANSTDATGAFLFDHVAEGDATLQVDDADGTSRTLALSVQQDESTVVVDPACREAPKGPGFGDVVGVVCNRHTASVVADASVTIVLEDGSTMTAQTDDAGRFQLWNVPTGRRIVEVVAEGYARSFVVDVIEGAVVQVETEAGTCTTPRLDEGMLHVALCDPMGGPFVGASVVVTDAAGSMFSTLTDSLGTADLGPMALGYAAIAVTRAPDVAWSLSALVQAQTTTDVSSGGSCVLETCDVVETNATVDPRIEMLLIVDRSGSMAAGAPGYDGTRFEGMRTALTDITATLTDTVAFGLALFPATGTSDETCGTGEMVVAPAFGNADAIASVLGDFSTEPIGATPTAAALAGVLAWHQSHPPAHTRVAVLATDGGPNCNDNLNPYECRCSAAPEDCVDSGDGRLCLDASASVAAVQALAQDDVKTYVLGIPGVENFGDVLDDMAAAGGTERYVLARDTEAIAEVVNEIGRENGGCSVAVDPRVGAAARVEVRVGGADVFHDLTHSEGFDVVTVGQVELYGDACALWLETGEMQVSICALTADGVSP